MGKDLAAEKNEPSAHGGELLKACLAGRVKDLQLPAVVVAPILIEVQNECQKPMLGSTLTIQVRFVKSAGRVEGEVGLRPRKRYQQLAAEIVAQPV